MLASLIIATITTVNAHSFTELIAKELKYHGTQRLANYVIMGENKFRRAFKNGKSGLEVEIKLGRKLTSIFMVTYLPTIVINIINQATNYFDGTMFSGDTVKVNLSSMMVLSAIYVSVSSSLPATASIKNVEIWLLFSFIYPFLIILTQTFIQRSKLRQSIEDSKMKVFPVHQEEESWKHRVTRVRVGEIIAKYLIPGCGLLFVITYFCYGFY